ncbi:MAG: hypothetical protein H7Y86_03980 [Rhizobacter sp.]|nr:hypothetical protein [Ferruginibacter sp.]
MSDKEFLNQVVTELLLHAITFRVRQINPDAVVTVQSNLKADAAIEPVILGELLAQSFQMPKTSMAYERLTTWYNDSDCTINEFAAKIVYARRHYPDKK